MKSNLSKYRSELMGGGALGVLIVHSNSIINYSGFIGKIVSYGGLGVYMFMFLSSIGLYYSLNSKDKIDLKYFYYRRIIKVFIPYLIVAGIWYGIKYILIEKNFFMFLYELSTLSFWLEHNGAWYVAALIPIYLIYPFFYQWTENKHRTIKHVLGILGILFLKVIIFRWNNDLYVHLAQVLNGMIVFIVGSYFADKIKYRNENGLWFVLCFFIFYLLKELFFNDLILPLNDFVHSFLGIVLCVLGAYALSRIKCDWIHLGLRWFGKRSLLLYLTNIFILQAVRYFDIMSFFHNGYILYGIVVVLGMICTFIFNFIISNNI